MQNTVCEIIYILNKAFQGIQDWSMESYTPAVRIQNIHFKKLLHEYQNE